MIEENWSIIFWKSLDENSELNNSLKILASATNLGIYQKRNWNLKLYYIDSLNNYLNYINKFLETQPTNLDQIKEIFPH